MLLPGFPAGQLYPLTEVINTSCKTSNHFQRMQMYWLFASIAIFSVLTIVFLQYWLSWRGATWSSTSTTWAESRDFQRSAPGLIIISSFHHRHQDFCQIQHHHHWQYMKKIKKRQSFRFYACEIILGLGHLHKEGIVYRFHNNFNKNLHYLH